MTNHPVAQASIPSEDPVASFSQCHAGIVSQLQLFAQLPVLQAAATRAREVAASMLTLFKHAVHEHHADEENELFPAVLRSAAPGKESQRVQAMVQRLTAEHRQIEARWKKLEPAVRAAARNEPSCLDMDEVDDLVQAYLAHACFEEAQFLPLADRILGRNDDHMAALGLALHLRRAAPVVGYI